MSRALTAFVLVAAAGTAFAQDTIVVPDDFPSLQDALDPAVSGIDPGDTIVLRDSITYFGTFDVTVPDLTIRAAAGDSPVLDANGAGSVITVNIGTANLTLEGLTIQDGSGVGNGDRGAGVEVANAGLVTIRGCLIRDNDADNSGGGGVGGTNYDLVVEDSIFRNNRGVDGGAIILVGTGNLTIRNTQLIENTATRDGGAILHRATASNTLVIEDSTLTGNACDDRGGAANLDDLGRVLISNTTFTDNTSIASAGSDAGAIFINVVADTTIIDSAFIGNLANGEGGAILSFLNTGGGDSVEYINTRFALNESSSSAVAMFGGTNDFVSCEFVDNTSLRAGDGPRQGGAIRFRTTQGGQRAFGRVFNSVFDGNSAEEGGAITVGTATVEIVNSTFVDNIGAPGQAIRAISSGTNLAVFSSVFAGHDDAVNLNGAGTTNIRFNLFDNDELFNGPGGNNLVETNPLFVDPSNGDYSLQAGSPAIDAGSSTLYEFGVFADFAGNLRVQDDPATPDTGAARTGPVIDMGAFEFDVVETVVNDCPADLVAPFGLTDLDDVNAFITSFLQGCP